MDPDTQMLERFGSGEVVDMRAPLLALLCTASAWQPQRATAPERLVARPVTRSVALRGFIGSVLVAAQAPAFAAAPGRKVIDETDVDDSLQSLMPSYADRKKDWTNGAPEATKAPAPKKMTEKEKLQAAAAAKKAAAAAKKQ